MACTKVSKWILLSSTPYDGFANVEPGIGPKVTQSVITAAFLFAFKDVLYDLSVQLRRKVPAKLPLK